MPTANEIFLDVTLKGNPQNVFSLVSSRGATVSFVWKHKFPRLYSYQRLELETLINNSPEQDLRISTKTLRWLIRDIVKHPKFMIYSLLKTKEIVTEPVHVEDLPLRLVPSSSQTRIWISRTSIRVGLFPSNLDESLEYDRLRNPGQFEVLVRSAFSQGTYQLFRKESYDFYFPTKLKDVRYGVEYETIKDVEILHGRFAVTSNSILQISNTRKEIIRRSPGYIEISGNKIHVLSSFECIRLLDQAVFFGSNLNWFHFIVECLTRYMALPMDKLDGVPIVLERGVHPNIIELCRILSKAEPVLVGPCESVYVRNLQLCREFGVGDSIDSSPRSELLLQIRDRLLQSFPDLKNRPDNLDNFYFRRKAKLFRPLQNEKRLVKTLEKLDFKFIYPEDLTVRELAEVLNRAHLVIIESGAAMTNLMFAPDWVKVIEINPGDGGFGFWRKFLEPFKLEHGGVVGKSRIFGPKGLCSDGYSVQIKTIRSQIALLTLEKK